METVVDEAYCVPKDESERELTVHKKSLFSSGDGFEAYDHNTGEVVFRVETYDRGHALATAEQIVLMDPVGAPILTVRRKWVSLHQRWDGFTGERKENQKPLFTVRHSSIFGGDHGTVAIEVHDNPAEYRVEGSFGQRSCRVLYEGEQETVVAAEIKPKKDMRAVMGRDVFRLCVKPGFDAALLMGVVLVLDNICGEDSTDDSIGDGGGGTGSEGAGVTDDSVDDGGGGTVGEGAGVTDDSIDDRGGGTGGEGAGVTDDSVDDGCGGTVGEGAGVTDDSIDDRGGGTGVEGAGVTDN